MHTLLLTYILAHLLTYLCIDLLHTRVKTVLLCKTVYTPLLSMSQTLIVFYVLGKLFTHTYTHAHIHTPALHWHTHNSFHRQRVSISPCKQTKCTYTHLTSRFLLTYLLTCSASNYLLHIIGKTMTPNKNVCTPCTKTKILLYLLTSLLTYYVMYSSSPSQKFLEWSKQQCHHADHHWASYSLMFIVLACS